MRLNYGIHYIKQKTVVFPYLRYEIISSFLYLIKNTKR